MAAPVGTASMSGIVTTSKGAAAPAAPSLPAPPSLPAALPAAPAPPPAIPPAPPIPAVDIPPPPAPPAIPPPPPCPPVPVPPDVPPQPPAATSAADDTAIASPAIFDLMLTPPARATSSRGLDVRLRKNGRELLGARDDRDGRLRHRQPIRVSSLRVS